MKRIPADQLTIINLFPHLRNQAGEIGIEIEMEGEHLNIYPLSHWLEQHDNSLRGTSVEWVLNRPVVRADVPKRLNYLHKKLEEQGAQCVPSDRCGVHIHLNCQEQTIVEVFNIITLYLMFEEVLIRYCGDDRVGNMFCLRASDAEDLIAHLVECRRETGFLNDRDMHRYAALNVAALSKFGSLEFRSLQTPEDIRDIQPWVDVICRLKDVAIRYNQPRELIEDLSTNGAKQFFNHVVGDHMVLFDYPEIEQDILRGMRQAQEVAYTRAIPKRVPSGPVGQEKRPPFGRLREIEQQPEAALAPEDIDFDDFI